VNFGAEIIILISKLKIVIIPLQNLYDESHTNLMASNVPPKIVKLVIY
jgi:hypothetical protein